MRTLLIMRPQTAGRCGAPRGHAASPAGACAWEYTRARPPAHNHCKARQRRHAAARSAQAALGAATLPEACTTAPGLAMGVSAGAGGAPVRGIVDVAEHAALHGIAADFLPAGDSPADAAPEQASPDATAPAAKCLLVVSAGRPLLLVLLACRRADERRLAELTGAPRRALRLATPAEVQAVTGFPVGAVPPFGHAAPLPTLLDLEVRPRGVPAREHVLTECRHWCGRWPPLPGSACALRGRNCMLMRPLAEAAAACSTALCLCARAFVWQSLELAACSHARVWPLPPSPERPANAECMRACLHVRTLPPVSLGAHSPGEQAAVSLSWPPSHAGAFLHVRRALDRPPSTPLLFTVTGLALRAGGAAGARAPGRRQRKHAAGHGHARAFGGRERARRRLCDRRARGCGRGRLRACA